MQRQVMGGWSGCDRDTIHTIIRHFIIKIIMNLLLKGEKKDNVALNENV